MLMSLLMALSIPGFAETAYVTNQFSVGLHEDKSSDSPIIKLVQSGNDLEIVKREDNFTYVADNEGTNGWIDNTYLLDIAPSTAQSGGEGLELQQTRQQFAEAQAEIDRLKNTALTSGAGDQDFIMLQDQYKALQQEFNSEQINAGELQVQLTEMRKRIGQDNDNASLYSEIEQLEQDNKSLEIQLAAVPGREGLDSPPDNAQSDQSSSSWRNTLIYFSITLFVGFCVGIYLMDFINRRRHAGLRI
jgi:SH3 domain protein